MNSSPTPETLHEDKPHADPTPDPTSKAVFTISETAAEFARKKLTTRGTPDAAIRLGIKGGGCSGYSYVIQFEDDPPRDRDRVFEVTGVRFIIDKKSLIYLAGAMLDYENKLMFQGFKFRNPNEAAGCGCGHSFQVR